MRKNDVSKVDRPALENVKDQVGIHISDFVMMTSTKEVVSDNQMEDSV